VLIRQRIVDLRPAAGDDAIERCENVLDQTHDQRRRACQGWRNLKPEDAPADLDQKSANAPPALRAKLAELGLL